MTANVLKWWNTNIVSDSLYAPVLFDWINEKSCVRWWKVLMFSVWQYKSGVRAKTVLEQPVNTALLYSVDTCSFPVCVCCRWWHGQHVNGPDGLWLWPDGHVRNGHEPWLRRLWRWRTGPHGWRHVRQRLWVESRLSDLCTKCKSGLDSWELCSYIELEVY